MNTYSLGKWALEAGPYRQWKDKLLAEFAEAHVIVKVEAVDLHNGMMELLVEGYAKPEGGKL